ncbi:hypothetical protein D6C91_02164 [Aureobasidium pullulans]|uniref:Uncharacterized protein n=1 Tax=Aureobasidium pullulans TaxID=5580 RepID=A0A4S9TSY9_AURPU|nr:hypothetical protein D6C91_02164 [Aureobasidium pullulans]
MSSNPEKSQLIQAYMILHSQQTNVRRRLSTDSNSSGSSSPGSSSSPSSSYNSPSSSFTAPSPAFSFSTKPSSPTTARRHSRSSSTSTRRSSLSPPTSPNRTTIPPIPEEETLEAPPPLSNDEVKLADISSRIKNTLTDLLNCDAVKSDSRMRSWVATRLMDVEHDLKEQKRRRHSSHAEDAELIASHLRV